VPAEKDDPRWKHIELGLAAQRFCESPLAQALIYDAETERREKVEQLAKLDADDPEFRSRFRRLQRRIDQLDCWQEFIASYIERGQAAEESLAGEDAPLGDEPELTHEET